jgi:hypothetical protein
VITILMLAMIGRISTLVNMLACGTFVDTILNIDLLWLLKLLLILFGSNREVPLLFSLYNSIY